MGRAGVPVVRPYWFVCLESVCCRWGGLDRHLGATRGRYCEYASTGSGSPTVNVGIKEWLYVDCVVRECRGGVARGRCQAGGGGYMDVDADEESGGYVPYPRLLRGADLQAGGSKPRYTGPLPTKF